MTEGIEYFDGLDFSELWEIICLVCGHLWPSVVGLLLICVITYAIMRVIGVPDKDYPVSKW